MPTEMLLPLGAALAGYLLGSIPFGVVVARVHGVEIRDVGSGNIGATNVARALGKGWGLLVMLLDAAKAAVPMLLFAALWPPAAQRELAEVALGAGAFLGHLFPIFLGLRGGKGVATAFGAFLALAPLAAVLGLVSWAVAYRASRISSVGSITAVVLFPVWLTLLEVPRLHWYFATLVFVMILLKHSGNIRRLLKRQENRV